MTVLPGCGEILSCSRGARAPESEVMGGQSVQTILMPPRPTLALMKIVGLEESKSLLLYNPRLI